jgi:hypothetical protein
VARKPKTIYQVVAQNGTVYVEFQSRVACERYIKSRWPETTLFQINERPANKKESV